MEVRAMIQRTLEVQKNIVEAQKAGLNKAKEVRNIRMTKSVLMRAVILMILGDEHD